MDAQTIKNLNDDGLISSLSDHFANERRMSHIILLHLGEIRRRRLYAERGFSSLFEMLIRFFRQSESSANQRIKALELMSDVPLAEERLKKGEVNLSTLAAAQRQIRREEKVTGKKISKTAKCEIVERIANKTQAQAEVELLRLLPESATLPKNCEKRVSAEATRLNLTLPDRVREKLMRLKDLWAHVDPSMDYVQLIERAADIALGKVDPLRKGSKRKQRATDSVAQGAGGKRPTYYSVRTDKELWTRADSQCEFIDGQTGLRCNCRFGLERDHVIPLALGGTNDLSNLRLLCKTHNLTMARRHFGTAVIDEKIRAKRGGLPG
jgi:5-methylcytosine-specific restriction endonuclease McrA